MEIRSLRSESIEEITFCFNQSFADYIVKFNATPEYLSNRWHAAAVNYDLSLGVYEGEKLTGFIIHAQNLQRKEVFNAATGVIPSSRGKGYVAKMYEFIRPILRETGMEKASLEVIVGNEPAIAAYRRSGFRELRKFHCFKGRAKTKTYHSIQQMKRLDPNRYNNFLEFEPSWENRFDALKRRKEELLILESKKGTEVTGFAVLVPEQNYLSTFAVHPDHQGKGVGQSLFFEVSEMIGEFKINNIDHRSQRTLEFLEKAGMTNHIDQYEMGTEL